MRKAIIPAVVLVLFVGLGCDLFSIPSDSGGDESELQWPPLTPRAVIEDIEWCYNNANLNFYPLLLDEDHFVFYFAPTDVGGDIPVSWAYKDEITATTNLFEAVGAPNIDLLLDFSEVENPDPGPYDTEWDLNRVAYKLVVYVAEEDRKYVANEHASFRLSKFEDEDQVMRWWLWKWWDIVD
jgi:hypothetical protein